MRLRQTWDVADLRELLSPGISIGDRHSCGRSLDLANKTCSGHGKVMPRALKSCSVCQETVLRLNEGKIRTGFGSVPGKILTSDVKLSRDDYL